MKLKLTVDVPDSATPEEVREQLVGAALRSQGITLHMPTGWLVDVDLVNVEDAEFELHEVTS